MEITEELILKFFRQECTAEERDAVSKYFDDYPDQLDKYLDEEGWKDFASTSPLPADLSKQMLDVIEDHIREKPVRRIFPFKALAIAASITIVAGIIALLAINLSKVKESGSQLSASQRSSPVQVLDTVDNKLNHEQLISLSDSTTVSLAANSKIIFRKVFGSDKRDVYLQGEATFNVAKNKHWPFTVFAGNFSTTALGTSFKITAFDHSNKTVIQLFTGKVVVKQLNTINGQKHEPIYLTPGFMVVANTLTNHIGVSGFVSGNETTLPSYEGSTVFDHDLIIFKNQSLTGVVDALKKVYHIDITANPHDLSNRYFTGAINSKSETLDAVLLTIARLNNLQVIKQRESYKLAAGKPQ